MPRLPPLQLQNILSAFRDSGITLTDLIVSVLHTGDASDDAVNDIATNLDRILQAMQQNVRVCNSMSASIHRLARAMYMGELAAASKKEAGTHFNAHRATEADLEGFDLVKLTAKLTSLAPHVCDLVDGLLSADHEITRRRSNRRRQRRHAKRRTKCDTDDRTPEVTVDDAVAQDRAMASNAPQDGPESDDSDTELWAQLPQLAQEEDYPMETDTDNDVDMLDAEGLDDEGNFTGAEGNEDDYFDGLEPLLEDPDGLEGMTDPYQEEERYEAILKMKRTLCMSVMMQSSNQHSNGLQSVMGLYLHSCNASEGIVELLSRIGVSISRSAIDDAVANLSKEAEVAMKRLGRTLLTMVAYDNFDVEIKHVVPTVDKEHDALLHMTSGTFIPLEHDVNLADLRCSDALWEKSPYNPENTRRAEDVDWKKLLTLHPQTEHPSGLDRRERHNAYIFKRDLFLHGPEYFHQFLAKLKEPEAVDCIPLVKSRQVPAEAMDINQSSVQGNIEALSTLFKQAGIGDPTDPDDKEQVGRCDVGNHVVLVHGDLATCERVQSLRQSRGEEKTPYRRFQLVIFVIVLFHLKMACVDALWKIFIHLTKARLDETSLMKQVAEIRPKETGKFSGKTSPGFRRMHEVVQHVGAVSRLECWRQEVSIRDPSCTSLDAWAKSAPSANNIDELANVLVKKYVADANFSEERYNQSPEARDEQFENTRLRERYFLLYHQENTPLRIPGQR